MAAQTKNFGYKAHIYKSVSGHSSSIQQTFSLAEENRICISYFKSCDTIFIKVSGRQNNRSCLNTVMVRGLFTIPNLLQYSAMYIYNATFGQKSSFWEVMVQIVLKRIQYLTHA